jgi:hypothetical protein
LKTVENGIKKLDSLISFVRDVKEVSILKSIKEIGSMCLFDKEVAFAKCWVFSY